LKKRCIVGLVLFGCGGAEHEAVTPVRPSRDVSASTQPTPSRPAPEVLQLVPLPPPLSVPERTGCVYTSDLQSEVPLRLAIAGAPFASLARGRNVKVSLLAGERAEGALFQADLGGATVRGHVSIASLKLYPQSAMAFGGFLFVDANTPARVIKSDAESVTFQPPYSTDKLAVVDPALADTKPCSALAPTKAKFDALSPLGHPPSSHPPSSGGERLALLPGKHALRKDINGPVVAYVLAVEGSSARLLQRSGTQVQVVWNVDGALAVGWLPRAALRPPQVELLAAMGPSVAVGDVSLSSGPLKGTVEAGAGLGGAGAGAANDNRVTDAAKSASKFAWRSRRCSNEVPLVAEVDEGRAVVGAIAPRAMFYIGPVESGWHPVLLAPALLKSDKGRLLVPSAKLANCDSTPSIPY
jgi:hypothetical protein